MKPLPLCVVLFSGWLSSCGGTSAAATDAGAAPPPGDVTPDTMPPGPDLDDSLAALAREANAAPMAPPPPQDPDLVALGQALFFDRILSGNRDISCYTCHDIDSGTGDALSVSIGAGGFGASADRELRDGLLIGRNAPGLFRLERQPTMFWDSRVERRPDGSLVTPEPLLNGRTPALREIASHLTTALAAQAMFPVASHEEMRGQPGENELADAEDNAEVWRLLLRRLVGTDDGGEPGIAGYRALFAAAYPEVTRWEEFHFGHAARAIAAFEVDAFSTRGAPFDAWLQGETDALTEQQKRGGILFFGRADCARCHRGPALTDGAHHALGIPQVGSGVDFPFEDTGRARLTGDPGDVYRFRTPTLRNVALTGPWMHDGAYTSLEGAVRHYVDPGRSLRTYDASQLAPLLQPLVDFDPVRQQARQRAISPIVRDGVALDDDDVADLLAFLEALTDAEALDLSASEPETVPSGIPIDD